MESDFRTPEYDDAQSYFEAGQIIRNAIGVEPLREFKITSDDKDSNSDLFIYNLQGTIILIQGTIEGANSNFKGYYNITLNSPDRSHESTVRHSRLERKLKEI